MSFVRIWLHMVWSTKNRFHYLSDKETRYQVFDHIKENSIKKDIHLDTVNGYTDHIHCLTTLRAKQQVAIVIQSIKGESSFWINKNKLIHTHFEWQDEYFAVSVSESQVNKVRLYIQNQETHHKKMTYTEEYEAFIKKYKF